MTFYFIFRLMQLVVRLLPFHAKYYLLQSYFEVHLDYLSYWLLFNLISSEVLFDFEGTLCLFFIIFRLTQLVLRLLPFHAKFSLFQPNFDAHLVYFSENKLLFGYSVNPFTPIGLLGGYLFKLFFFIKLKQTL